MDKQEIIEEIKRTAKLNNGKALGQRAFINETGIKGGDWRPHYWLRWGEAVEEAGLSQNQFGKTALSSDDSIEKVIGFIRDLGHFPLDVEMQRKKNQDSAFPHQSTLRRMFGGKKKLAAAIMKYCQIRVGFEDVIEVCSGHVGEDEPASADDTQTEKAADGFVYLMKSGRYYKIGRTDAVGRRHKEIRTQMPESVDIIHYIGTDDPSGIEAYWHKRFASKRKEGEWFDLTRTDINAFKRRKKFM